MITGTLEQKYRNMFSFLVKKSRSGTSEQNLDFYKNTKIGTYRNMNQISVIPNSTTKNTELGTKICFRKQKDKNSEFRTETCFQF